MTVPHFSATPIFLGHREDASTRVSECAEFDLVALKLSKHKFAILLEVAPSHSRYGLQLVCDLREELTRVFQNAACTNIEIMQRIDKTTVI